MCARPSSRLRVGRSRPRACREAIACGPVWPCGLLWPRAHAAMHTRPPLAAACGFSLRCVCRGLHRAARPVALCVAARGPMPRPGPPKTPHTRASQARSVASTTGHTLAESPRACAARPVTLWPCGRGPPPLCTPDPHTRASQARSVASTASYFPSGCSSPRSVSRASRPSSTSKARWACSSGSATSSARRATCSNPNPSPKP